MVVARDATNNSHNNVNNKKGGDGEALVFGHRLSSVGPARVTGDLTYEPSNIDLAMKLHYLRIVYLFDRQATEGLTIPKLKEAIFTWLNHYYESCGRFRRADGSGRPYIKCNDCGMRFVEAQSSKTLQDWLQLGDTSPQRLLVPQDHVLGPELTFSPLVFIQVTFLKCGGMSLGLSWAHVLGDAFSLTQYMNTLAQILKGQGPTLLPPDKRSSSDIYNKPTNQVPSGPLTTQKVGPLGDHWFKPTDCEMGTFSFHLTATQLAQLEAEISGSDQAPGPTRTFELISAVLWQAMSRVRVGPEPSTVTVIRQGGHGPKPGDLALKNGQVVSSVRADCSIAKAHLTDLVALFHERAEDERAQIADMVGQDPKGPDFIVYGANPTFVDLGEAELSGFEINGLGPKFVNIFVDGIGEGGVVLVLPGPKDVKGMKTLENGKIITLTLPNSYMEGLKEILKKELALFS